MSKSITLLIVNCDCWINHVDFDLHFSFDSNNFTYILKNPIGIFTFQHPTYYFASIYFYTRCISIMLTKSSLKDNIFIVVCSREYLSGYCVISLLRGQLRQQSSASWGLEGSHSAVPEKRKKWTFFCLQKLLRHPQYPYLVQGVKPHPSILCCFQYPLTSLGNQAMVNESS